MNARQTLNIFVEQGIVDPRVMDDILQEVAGTGKTLCDVLVEYEAVTEEGYYQAIANAIGSEFVNLKDFAPPADLLKLLPAGLAQLHRAFPLGYEDNMLQVALIDPLQSDFSLLTAPETINFGLLVVVLILASIGVSAVGSGLSLRRFLRI